MVGAPELAAAVDALGPLVECSPGRSPGNGPHETREFGPALSSALAKQGIERSRIKLNHRLRIANFTRPDSQVDLVVLGSGGTELVAELKCWDIGHQLFDLAKVCCLLSSGIPSGCLVCAARNSADFDNQTGGELFPATLGESREHSFRRLFVDHQQEWRWLVGKGTPEPTQVPTNVITQAVAAGVELDAYPGHEVRAVEVMIGDATPVELSTLMIGESPVPEGT